MLLIVSYNALVLILVYLKIWIVQKSYESMLKIAEGSYTQCQNVKNNLHLFDHTIICILQ